MKKTSSGQDLDANLEMTQIWQCCRLTIVQALHIQRPKNNSGQNPGKKTYFSLVSLSVYAFTLMCGTDTATRGALEPPIRRSNEAIRPTTPGPTISYSSCRRFFLRDKGARKNGYEPIYIRLTCKPSTLEM